VDKRKSLYITFFAALLCTLIWLSITFATPLVGFACTNTLATIVLSLIISAGYYGSRIMQPANSATGNEAFEFIQYAILGFYFPCVFTLGVLYMLSGTWTVIQISILGIFLAPLPMWVFGLIAELITTFIVVKEN